jgi:hypothetical protein
MQHSVIYDLSVNLTELFVAMVVGYLLNVKRSMAVNRASAIGIIVYSILCYCSARFDHVSWYLVPLNGGISWTRANFFLFLLCYGLGSLLYSHFKKDSGNN